MNDPAGARAMYEQILADDPGQVRASDALCRLYERSKDYQSLTKILGNRADAQRGEEKVKTLCRIAELYEATDHAVARLLERVDPATRVVAFAASGGLRRTRAREAQEQKELEARRAVLRVEGSLRDTRRETDEVISFWRDFLQGIL